MNSNLILATKLRYALQKRGGKYVYSLSNVRINGVNRGCSGFIRNKENGTCVYVDTEIPVYNVMGLYMFRYADNEKDKLEK